MRAQSESVTCKPRAEQLAAKVKRAEVELAAARAAAEANKAAEAKKKAGEETKAGEELTRAEKIV